MTNKEILNADLLDILFEHRNKSYGAYALRKQYHHRLGIALGLAMSTALLFFLLTSLGNKNDPNENPFKKDDIVQLTAVVLPEEPEEPEPEQETQPQPENIAQADHQPIIVVPDHEADPLIADIDLIERSVISNTTIAGNPADGIFKPSPVTSGNGDSAAVKTTPQKEFIKEERNASFPGGAESWMNFLKRFLQTPDELEPGERKEVRVKFQIDADGTLSGFEIVQSGGREFDKEVLRVMKKMPKWEPAVQNGKNVPVTFTQPVTFVGAVE